MRLDTVYKVVSENLGELPIQVNGSSFKPAGEKRKTMIGDVPENNGFTVSFAVAVLKLKLNAAFNDKMTLINLAKNDIDKLTITTKNGDQYMMPQAWIIEPGALADGEVDIEYNSATSPYLGNENEKK